MIESFRHKGLRKFYEFNDHSGLNPQHCGKIKTILSVLEGAETLEEMKIAAFRLHPLTGDRKGFYAITVRANWRITFRFDKARAYDVNLEDYH